jgi:PKD domain
MLVAFGCALGATAPTASASLSVPTGGPPSTITGSGTSGVQAAIASFEANIPGGDNGTASGEQGAGFRRANWDGLAVDGSDPGSTVIEPGHVATVPPDALQPWGLEVGPEIAVANDGFLSVNPNADFTPFSAPNVWGPYNSTSAEFDVIAPAGQGSTPTPAETRGLGIVFLNATATTQITYYNGDNVLAQGSVSPPAGAGPSFAGLLYPDAVVTRVVVTLGGASEIFGFNGTTVTPGGSGPVAADDVILAEPAPARPTVVATVGIPVSAVLDTFTNTESQATATIDWGDGTRTAGTIADLGGGVFNVIGNHAYAAPGSYTATVTVSDATGDQQTSQTLVQVGTRLSQTSVTCSPATVSVSAATLCAAVVSDASPGSVTAPTGVVTFSSPTAGGLFPTAGSCTLGATALPGASMCVVQFEPSQRPPVHAGVIATYRGDSLHTASQSATTVAVQNQHCSLSVLSRGLRAGGFGVLVTCDARANVQVGGQARVTRSGPFRAFALTFGSGRSLVSPGRPTVLVIKPAHGVVRALRAALGRHQHVSLKLTLTATSHTARTTITKRVSAIRAF